MRNEKESKKFWLKRERKRNILLKALILLIFPISVGLFPVSAQEAIPSSGGNASGVGGSVSYSVGQVVYTTNSGTNGSEAQGVQQPYEISVVTGINEVKNIHLDCSVFPNPATNFLILKIDGEVNPNFTASLYDLNGKLLLTKNVESNETTFPVGILVPATYFLRLTNENKEIKSFKIIKK